MLFCVLGFKCINFENNSIDNEVELIDPFLNNNNDNPLLYNKMWWNFILFKNYVIWNVFKK